MNTKELSKLFKVPLSWCYKQQEINIVNQTTGMQDKISMFVKDIYECSPKSLWFVEDELNKANDKLNKLEKKKLWLDRMISNHKKAEETKVEYVPKQADYNIEEIKRVPINRIVEIMPSGFFKNNPFRKERSPSNSLHLNRKTNRWCDYGSGGYGSNIDLVMKLEGCTFREALEYLSGF